MPAPKFDRDAIVKDVCAVRDWGLSPEQVHPQRVGELCAMFMKIAPFLDTGLPHDAFITKVLTGGRSPIPVVQAYVYRADAAVAQLVYEKDVPAKVLP